MLDQPYLDQFKSDLVSLSGEEVFGRYVMTEVCMGLTDIDHKELRRRIADNFSLPVENVVIVGSAKLGFTLRHKKATEDSDERPRYSPFSENSDVDIAIVSDALFDAIWKRCFEFWHSSGYAHATAYWQGGGKFRDYIFRGWMRPDHLPAEGRFDYRSEWFDFFRKLSSDRAAGDYKVSGGLYREEYFLRAYQLIAINECKMELGVP